MSKAHVRKRRSVKPDQREPCTVIPHLSYCSPLFLETITHPPITMLEGLTEQTKNCDLSIIAREPLPIHCGGFVCPLASKRLRVRLFLSPSRCFIPRLFEWWSAREGTGSEVKMAIALSSYAFHATVLDPAQKDLPKICLDLDQTTIGQRLCAKRYSYV